MDHMQRVMRLIHVDLGESAPGAAHGIESAALHLLQPVKLFQLAVDDLLRGVEIAIGRFDQAQGTDRQGHLLRDLALVEQHQLKAAAAQVAHQAIGIGHAGEHAERGQLRFLLARDHAHGDAGGALDLLGEFLAVLGIAHGGGRQHLDVGDVHRAGQRDEAADVGQRFLAALGIELAGALQPLAQARQRLFVEDRNQAARALVIDDEANGVRSDVDDRDPPGLCRFGDRGCLPQRCRQ
jgi:hypothetical protein